MWQIEPTDRFLADQKWYAKKRPRELEAVLNNLRRYMDQLNVSRNAGCVEGGYLHTEGGGILAVDEKGATGSLQGTRLYFFSEQEERIVYLITIGNKDKDQKADVKLCQKFLASLKSNK